MMHEDSAPAARSGRPPETRAEQSSANQHDADQKALRIARHTRVSSGASIARQRHCNGRSSS